MRLVRREYGDFGPTLIAENLAQEHGVVVGKETVRKWMIGEELWKPKRARVGQVHTWRARRECRGELLQWDTSVPAWLEDRGPAKMYLVALIDDATNTLYARFVEADTTEQNMPVWWGYLERYGRPQAVYTDKAGMFQPTLPPGWKTEDPGEKTETQIGRAWRELGIEWIAAHSRQAKGRVERCFGTLQDRLVKALRKARVRTLEAANAYLEEVFLAMWNQRFVCAPASSVDGHRSLENLELNSILSVVETRRVDNDHTVPWRAAAGRGATSQSAIQTGAGSKPMDGPVSRERQRGLANLSSATNSKTKSTGSGELMFWRSKLACGSKEFNAPFPVSPSGASRGGRVPPASAVLVQIAVSRKQELSIWLKTGTFYLALTIWKIFAVVRHQHKLMQQGRRSNDNIGSGESSALPRPFILEQTSVASQIAVDIIVFEIVFGIRLGKPVSAWTHAAVLPVDRVNDDRGVQ